MAVLRPTFVPDAVRCVGIGCAGMAVAASRPQAVIGSLAGRCVRMGVSLLLMSAVVAGSAVFVSSLHAQTTLPPQNALFSLSHTDNHNPYDAPVPGFIGPDGEGRANLFDFDREDRPDPGPVNDYGANNYVNPIFLGWASRVLAYQPTPTVVQNWRFSGEMLGPVTGDNFSVVSLGDLTEAELSAGAQPGSITVSFARRIYNAPGADIVIFENGFISDGNSGGGSVQGEFFAELAYLEVSSNGSDFVRFPSISRTAQRVGDYGTINPRNIYNLVGKHANAYGRSWGTPFDLSDLKDMPLVKSGAVNLNNIRYLRIVDIPGSGDFLDWFGHPIYDAWFTWGSGGADIEAAGAISQPHYYDDWIARHNAPRPHGLRAHDQALLVGEPEMDEDGDGLSNALEYIMALDPRQSDGRQPLHLRYDAAQNALYLSFNIDMRVADYRLLLERADGTQAPLQWRSVFAIGPLGDEHHIDPALGDVSSVSLSPQASIGVIRRYTVRIDNAVNGASATSQRFFRLRAEMVTGVE